MLVPNRDVCVYTYLLPEMEEWINDGFLKPFNL